MSNSAKWQIYISWSLVSSKWSASNLIFIKIPAISSSNGIPTEYSPLAVILFLTALKDLVEDYQRHKSDSKENKRKILHSGNV